MPRKSDRKEKKTDPTAVSKEKRQSPSKGTSSVPLEGQKDVRPGRDCPIVGIGASAGGLEAFLSFFSEMSEDSGIAFVLISHLDPNHVSILPEILQKKTKMEVLQVQDNMKVAPNHVYVIPPNKNMAILNGSLQLLEMPRHRGVDLPIDTFFRSLAQDQTDNAIAIILSGTGSDGTIGLRAIKGENGMVMVQNPESAQYDGMPRSAMATGLADYVLAPAKMPGQLLQYLKHASQKGLVPSAGQDTDIGNHLQKIYLLLRTRTNHDFSLYKKNTIYRRIERRMNVHQIDKIADYVRYLQESDQEINILFKELLIGVTSFFRDPQAFEVLQDKYLPELVGNKPEGYSIRVWVPGCSTGEEVYSLAIILYEYLQASGRHNNVQIFGTDIDTAAIDRARIGSFLENIAADVSPDRLTRFFSRVDDQYQIKKMIREMVIFAPQNIIKDPPFTKIDLISCRNLLIYFESELQQKVLPMFHYSLNENGILFLGASESTGKSTDFFSLQDKKWKIFRRLATETFDRTLINFSAPQPVVAPPLKKGGPAASQPDGVTTLKLVKMILQQSALPSCAIIDDRANIVYIHGRTGRFLEPAEGEPNFNLLEMMRPGLKMGVATAIRKVAMDRRELIVKNLQVETNGKVTNFNLIVRPISDQQTGYCGLMMVIFDESETPKDKGSGGASQPLEKRDDVSTLKDELRYTKENVQTTIEELETANEELQSANEELQSANEELETSREELQSLNEESNTVNAELQGRIDELSKAYDDMKNLLMATQIATIFIDTDLCVTRFTPQIRDIVSLTSQDKGRPLSHFAANLKGPKLTEYAHQVLDDLVTRDLQLESTDGKYYRMRVTPYRTTNNVIAGVVFTFDDTSSLVKTQADSRLLAAMVENSTDAIITQDLNGQIITWNKGAERLYGWSAEEALQKNFSAIAPAPQNDGVAALIQKVTTQEMPPFSAKRLTKGGAEIEVLVTVNKVVNEENKIVGISTTERDLSLMTYNK